MYIVFFFFFMKISCRYSHLTSDFSDSSPTPRDGGGYGVGMTAGRTFAYVLKIRVPACLHFLFRLYLTIWLRLHQYFLRLTLPSLQLRPTSQARVNVKMEKMSAQRIPVLVSRSKMTLRESLMQLNVRSSRCVLGINRGRVLPLVPGPEHSCVCSQCAPSLSRTIVKQLQQLTMWIASNNH